jgi:hypothetical protein
MRGRQVIKQQAPCCDPETQLPDLITIPGINRSGELPAPQNGSLVLAGVVADRDGYHRDVPDTHYYYG